jgi:hypothetical protein
MTDWLRSRRAENGDEVNALKTLFTDRHHPLTSVEARAGPQNRSAKKRQKAAMNLPLFVAFGHWQLSQFAAFCRFQFNATKRLSTPVNISRPCRRNHPAKSRPGRADVSG